MVLFRPATRSEPPNRTFWNSLLKIVREAGHSVDEIAFNDALTSNLRRGRFLLLIVGDGIHEGVEAIAEYLQAHTGLHFTLGLVELPIYRCPDGRLFVVPRILARTETITRTVVAVPEGMVVTEYEEEAEAGRPSIEGNRARDETRLARRADGFDFWNEFLSGLLLDDPDQPIPLPSRGGHVVFKFGAPGGSSWLTVYRVKNENRVGLFLSGNKQSPGHAAAKLLARDVTGLREELGEEAAIDFSRDANEFPVIQDAAVVASLDDPEDRAAAFTWLRARTNDFVNALRPRIRAALEELSGKQ